MDAIKVDCNYRESDFQSPDTTFLPLAESTAFFVQFRHFCPTDIIFVQFRHFRPPDIIFVQLRIRICSGAQVRSSDHIFELGPKVEPPRVCSFIIETTLSRLGREISMRAPVRFARSRENRSFARVKNRSFARGIFF